MNAMGANGRWPAGEVFTRALQTGVTMPKTTSELLRPISCVTTGTKYYARTNHLIIPEALCSCPSGHLRQAIRRQSLVKIARSAGHAAQWDKSVAESLEDGEGRRRRIWSRSKPFYDGHREAGVIASSSPTRPAQPIWSSAFQDVK